jgi:hypothetical protein
MSSSAYALPRPVGLRFWYSWSPAEDRQLRLLLKDGTQVADIADELGRSSSAIRARAFELGLRVARTQPAD